jgi:hypothetical protein
MTMDEALRGARLWQQMWSVKMICDEAERCQVIGNDGKALVICDTSEEAERWIRGQAGASR